MKRILFLLTLLMTCAGTGFAQNGEPIKWSYRIDKAAGGKSYELVLHAELAKGWHLFSQTPGGDGSLIAPSFQLPQNLVAKKGKLEERGKLKRMEMEGIDGTVNYYENGVDFVAPLKLTGHGLQTLAFKHEYQICNETTCLAPKTVSGSAQVTLP